MPSPGGHGHGMWNEPGRKRILAREFQHTYFSAGGGLEFGYDVTHRVSIFADGEAQWASITKEDTQTLVSLDPTHLRTFDSSLTFPLSAGLRAHI